MTNEEFVAGLMSYSRHGALTQVFVIEAIRFYAELIKGQPDVEDKPDAMFSAKKWKAVAADVHTQMKAQYEG